MTTLKSYTIALRASLTHLNAAPKPDSCLDKLFRCRAVIAQDK